MMALLFPPTNTATNTKRQVAFGNWVTSRTTVFQGERSDEEALDRISLGVRPPLPYLPIPYFNLHTITA